MAGPWRRSVMARCHAGSVAPQYLRRTFFASQRPAIPEYVTPPHAHHSTAPMWLPGVVSMVHISLDCATHRWFLRGGRT
ncbi:hypothetical protein [Actinophytocola sp. NPDC049390]|uniref:hypothetical protein n=1 Tax=Actinophytocola sp. NPDC049390 TaxID=3363894 RepID=UPI0037A390DE